MFDSCVLGVDPGLSALGLAALGKRGRRSELLHLETVRTRSGLAEAGRLRLLHEAVADAIAEYRPDSVAIERIAWNTNQVSAMDVARASGVVILAAAEAGLPVEEYGPLEVKMAVTGQGNADKAQVRGTRSSGSIGCADVPSQPDAVDAVAIALCHLPQSQASPSGGRPT